jgi:hypothetical protein
MSNNGSNNGNNGSNTGNNGSNKGNNRSSNRKYSPLNWRGYNVPPIPRPLVSTEEDVLREYGRFLIPPDRIPNREIYTLYRFLFFAILLWKDMSINPDVFTKYKKIKDNKFFDDVYGKLVFDQIELGESEYKGFKDIELIKLLIPMIHIEDGEEDENAEKYDKLGDELFYYIILYVLFKFPERITEQIDNYKFLYENLREEFFMVEEEDSMIMTTALLSHMEINPNDLNTQAEQLKRLKLFFKDYLEDVPSERNMRQTLAKHVREKVVLRQNPQGNSILKMGLLHPYLRQNNAATKRMYRHFNVMGDIKKLGKSMRHLPFKQRQQIGRTRKQTPKGTSI